ncbi:SdrD B-like domain-containing protein, partial [Methylobacterium sp. Leaf88]|uniref:SdrD B-like domain-containing protein n=1 Tax=Methylobacterium sp. Leaf88 TaxID=1736244 RepID=UPI00244EC696
MAGATLSGAVFTDANGNGTRDANETALAGVSVDLLAADGSGAALATVRTDATGAYAFTALAGGAYAMRFTPAAAGYRGSAGTTNASGQTLVTNVSVPSDAKTTVDEGFYKTGSIAGIIFNDTNGNGVFNAGEVLTNGVSVDLYNDIGVLLASTTSSNKDPFKPGTNGVYSFQNLAPGTYTVAVTAPDGKVTSGVTTLKEVVTSGAVIASQNFGVRNNPPTVSLSGTIFADGDGNGRQGPGEAGLAGTSVLLSDAATGFALKTTVTDAAGHYSFGTTAGSYRVTVATPEGLKGTTATTLATGSLASGAANAQLNVGFAPDPVLDKTGAIPAATVLNVVLRGQSNTYFPTLYGDLPKLEAAIEAQLGFDGVRQRVNVIGTRDNADGANTEWPGTGMLTDWLSPVNGDYRNGWTANAQEIGLLSTIGQWSAAQKAAPTAVVWLHNENDSQNAALTPAMWESAVRYEAGLVRGVLGQDAATVPYLFVNAIPFPAQTPAVQSTQPVQNQAIRVGQAELTEDKDFNAGYAARQASDVDMDVDGHGITRQPGSVHFSRADATQIFDRIALSIAETFRASALPGSPLALASGDIDDDGPRVVRAERVAGAPDQLLLTVAFDQATSLQALGSVAAAGTGWSLRADWNAAASQALATRAELVDASHLRLTFDRDVPAATELFYGWGGARIALPGQPGIGAAIYDDNDLPLWVDPRGLAVSQAVTQAGPIAVQSIADSGPGIDGSGNGLLKAGAAVTLAVQFTDAVAVTGTPVLTLNTGATAAYAGGSGTGTLRFTYTVAPGQTAQDLAVTGIDLTNATLAGTDGSPVTLAGFTTAMPGTLTIDTTAPSLALTQIPAATIQATSAAGAAVTFAATATDAVDGTDPVTFREGTMVVASGQTFGLGPHTLTATATDAAGNSADPVGFSFTVADTAKPVIAVTAPATTIQATSAAGAAVTFAATA